MFQNIVNVPGKIEKIINNLRLKRGARMILQNKLTIQEIALEIGFSDISYFRTCFREKFGMSASEYYKNNSTRND